MRHTPYAVARFDGALVYPSIRAGLMTTGLTKSPVVHFKVKAGVQSHPIWALDDLALEIYSYCLAAKEASASNTTLQVSVTASWVSTEKYSNLVATHIEWHTSPHLRVTAEHTYTTLRNNKRKGWPVDEIQLPVAQSA